MYLIFDGRDVVKTYDLITKHLDLKATSRTKIRAARFVGISEEVPTQTPILILTFMRAVRRGGQILLDGLVNNRRSRR